MGITFLENPKTYPEKNYNTKWEKTISGIQEKAASINVFVQEENPKNFVI